LGRTEFLTATIASELGWKAKTISESEMALVSECRPQRAQTVLDTADIVRDGDFATRHFQGSRSSAYVVVDC